MKRTVPIIASFISILLCLSCVRDTDFDQTEDIVLSPVVELDLIFFNLEAQDFYDSDSQTPRLRVVDTTEIKFLDATDLQDGLVRAEFLFDFTNSIPRNFDVDFQFLSETNDTTYTTQTSVGSGTIAQPVETIFIETVADEDIMRLTMADRVVVGVTIDEANENLEGTLNLQSKTTYFLEIRE